PDQSEKLLEQFEERWKSALDRPAVKVPYLRIKGNIQYRKGHFEKALHQYLAAKQHLPEITDDIEKGYVYSNLGKTYVLLAHPSMGILYADKALEIMNRHDRLLEVCNLLHLKGTCLCHIGEYNEAILLFERIIRMCNQFLLCQLFASRAYHGMGICHMKRGNYPTAIRLFHQSIRVVSPNKLPEWEIGVVHQALGYTHLNAGNLKKAKRYVKSAMRRLKDRPNLYAECLVYLGMIHHAEGDLRRFEFCYRRAIDIFLSLGIHEKTARAAQTLGEFLSRADKPYQAVRYLKIAAEHYSKLVPTVDFDSELPGWDKNERQTSKTTQHRIV
ncbi:MAG: tetratricopeptide repeat protein, partial [Planifilum fimeticola]